MPTPRRPELFNDVLRPLDTLLLALGRYGPWARGWMIYRALVVLSVPERPRRQG